MMIHAFRLLAGTFALATSVFLAEASGAELKVLSAGAMRAALQELAPAFEAASGNKLKIEYSTAGDIEKKVAAGDEIDVAILTKPRVDKLVSEAKIVGGSTQTLARPDRSGGTEGCRKARHQLCRSVQESGAQCQIGRVCRSGERRHQWAVPGEGVREAGYLHRSQTEDAARCGKCHPGTIGWRNGGPWRSGARYTADYRTDGGGGYRRGWAPACRVAKP